MAFASGVDRSKEHCQSGWSECTKFYFTSSKGGLKSQPQQAKVVPRMLAPAQNTYVLPSCLGEALTLGVPMGKMPISQEELVDRALSAIWLEPGCQAIKAVIVTTVTIVNDRSVEWHIEVIDPGSVNPEIAYRAADRVKDALAAEYDLIDPHPTSPP
jgi:hypothetical protein